MSIPSFSGARVRSGRGKKFVDLTFKGLTGSQEQFVLETIAQRMGGRSAVRLDEGTGDGTTIVICEVMAQQGRKLDTTLGWVKANASQVARQLIIDLMPTTTPPRASAEATRLLAGNTDRPNGRRRPGRPVPVHQT